MLRKLVLFSVLTVCFAVAAVGQTPKSKQAVTDMRKEADIKAAIIKLEDANNTARLTGDGVALEALYADDFGGINAAGGITSKTQIVRFYSGKKPIVVISATDNVTMRVIDRVVIVTGRLKYQYNETQEDGKVQWLRYTRIYQQRGAQWQIVREHFCFTPAPETT